MICEKCKEEITGRVYAVITSDNERIEQYFCCESCRAIKNEMKEVA